MALLLLAAACTTTTAPSRPAHAWDADGDGLVSRAEFRSGAGQSGLYGRWDADGDGRLTLSEYRAGPGRMPLLEPSVAGDLERGEDEWIDEDEVLDGTFDSFDEDGSLRLDPNELGRFERAAGIEGIYR